MTLASAAAQEINCTEEFFRIWRHPEDCTRFTVCMNNNRVDFRCDADQVFDEDRVACRSGNDETCEFIVAPIPPDACQFFFLGVFPHPDAFECNRFFTCLNYNMIPFTCDPGQIFSPELERCVNGNIRTCQASPRSN